MADFLTSLWTSVFTPGPTPTLLVATNATFAALQLVLAALLAYTYSIHFAVLSVLCAGLWASINWFAAELGRAEAEAEREGKQSRTGEEMGSGTGHGGTGRGEGDVVLRQRSRRGKIDVGEGTGTETETEVEDARTPRRSVRVQRMRSQTPLEGGATTAAVAATGREGKAEMRRRMEGSGYLSTDSEWEKVESER